MRPGTSYLTDKKPKTRSYVEVSDAVQKHVAKHGRAGGPYGWMGPQSLVDVRKALAEAKDELLAAVKSGEALHEQFEAKSRSMSRRHEDEREAINARCRAGALQRTALVQEIERANAGVAIVVDRADLLRRRDAFNAAATQLDSESRDMQKRHKRELEDFYLERIAAYTPALEKAKEAKAWEELLAEFEPIRAEEDRKRETDRLHAEGKARGLW